MKSQKNETAYQEKEITTLWNPYFISVLLLGFLTGTANQMVNPMISNYSVSMGASLALAGTIVGLQSGIAIFLRPIAGMCCDVLNRKYVMIGSVIVSALAYIVYFLTNSLPAVIFARIMEGVSFAFMSVARTSMATSFMPRDRIGEGVGFTSFGIVLSQAIGPGIGLWISDRWGSKACFAVALIVSVVGTVMFSFVPYHHVTKQFRIKDIRLNDLIAVSCLPIALLAGMFASTTQLVNAFLEIIAEERSVSGIGLFFTVYAFTALALRPVSGKMLDRKGLPYVLYPAFVFAAASMALIGIADTLPLFIAASVFKAFSEGVASPAIQAASVKKMGVDHAGVTVATIHIGQDILQSIAPTVGGVLASRIGYTDTFFTFAVILLLGIPAYTLLRFLENRKKRGASV